MSGVTKIGPHGLAMIEAHEGWSSCPYWDQFGRVWTRGYGVTIGIHKTSPCISRHAGELELINLFQSEFAGSINGLGVKLNGNQFDALGDAVWNIGPALLTEWDVGRFLRAGEFRAATNALRAYNRSGGVVLSDLTARREAEIKLFWTPAAMPKPDPYAIYSKDKVRIFGREFEEYTMIKRFDADLKSHKVSHEQLHREQLDLLILRKWLWTVVHENPKHPNWSMNRGARWQGLLKRTRNLDVVPASAK